MAQVGGLERPPESELNPGVIAAVVGCRLLGAGLLKQGEVGLLK